DRLGVDDGIADLAGLLGHQSPPDGIALGPEVRALVVEAQRLAVDHDAQRHAIAPRTDPAVGQRRARVDRHRVDLRWIADAVRALVQQVAQQDAAVEPRAADQEVLGGPFARLVLPPGLAQPFAIGLEAARGDDAGPRLDALVAQP